MKQTITILFLACGITILSAQEYPKKEVDLEILADQLFGFQDLDLNYQDLYENMAQLLSNQINVNKATADELRFLNLLSESQIQNLLKYRQENGDLISVYELQSVPEFDLTTINKIIPFITTASTTSEGNLLNRILHEKNNYLILRFDRTLEIKEGFRKNANEQSRFRGDENEMYVRFRTSSPGDFSLGFTVEKDAGETISWNSHDRQHGFDYYSSHAQIQNKGNLKNLIIGDYQTQFGQGLLLGGSFGYGKGSETVMTVRRSNLGFLPYTSVNETGYKRGIALTYQVLPTLFVSPFYSNTWRDGSVASDSINEESVSSFQTTGFHRNINEISDRKQVRELNYGTVLNYRKNNLDAGLIFNTIEFNKTISRNPQPYNQFAFTGDRMTSVGAFVNYTFFNITLFSEVAKTIDWGYGFTAGLLGSLTPKLDIALNVRYFQRDFQSLYSNAFSESSQVQNESGIYWGWKYSWNRKLSASGYADLFRFPWLRFRSYTPSQGHEWLLRLNYQLSKTILMYVQVREESKDRNLSIENSAQYKTAEGTKRNYWINCDYGLTPKIKLKTRAQFSTFNFGSTSTSGIALIQDISFDLGKLNLTGRYALFDTDDFDNRQYAFEREVWLAYSLPAYAGKGIRSYILAEYSVSKRLSVWLRYARTRYADRDEIGSGADTIQGDTKTDIRIQVRIRF